MAEDAAQRSVELAALLEKMRMDKTIADEVTRLRADLVKHIAVEETETKAMKVAVDGLIKTVSDLNIAINSRKFEADRDLQACKSKLREELNSEQHANIKSLKVELTKDITDLASAIRESTKARDEELRLIYRRLEAIESRQAGFAEHIDMFKKIIATVLGAVVLAVISYINIKGGQ